jgi:tRNA (guanosine-2'-O-)-methyltransferase
MPMTPDRFAKLQRALDARQPDLTVFMDAVNKPHNLTAIIRTADAVGIQRLHTTSMGNSVRRHHMTAGGEKHWVAITAHRSARAAVAALRAERWRLVAAHAGEKTRCYRDIDYTQKVAIMVGAEHVGLSDAARAEADAHVAIPMHGLGTSLNVSVAVGMILIEAERQRLAAGLYDKSRLTTEERTRTLFEWAYPDIPQRYHALGRPYPALTADGMIAWNPLIDVSTVSSEH